MLIKLSHDYTAICSENLLGYVGETSSRTIHFAGLNVEGADLYKLRVHYADETAYEVEITDGKYIIDGSILREAGEVKCQIFACKRNGDNSYELVKKSDIFRLVIKASLNGEIAPVPTFEQAQGVLEDILTAKNEVETAVENANEIAEQFAETANSKLDKTFLGNNRYNPQNIVEGYVQNGVNKVANESYFTTEDIPIDTSKGSLFCGVANENGILTEQQFRFALFILSDGTVSYTQKVTAAEIPENAVYFVGTFANEVKEKRIYIGYGDNCEGVIYQPYGEVDVLTTLKDAADKTVVNSVQIADLTAIYNGKISSIMKPLFTDGENLQIKLIGDSITMGAQGTGVNDADENNDLIYTTSTRSYYENTAGHCWANSLRDYFAEKFGCVVKNYGVTGSTSYSILANIDSIVRDEDDICIVSIGINDRQKATKAETKARIEGIYEAIREKGKKCILMSQIPESISNEEKYIENNYHSEDLDIILQTIAMEKNIEYISMYKLMNDYLTNHNITVESLLSSDGIHPNDYGYDVMFRLAAAALGVPVKREGATW